MTKTEFELLTAPPAAPSVRGEMLEDQTPRTLIYGYTADRNTFHVYLDTDGLLHRVIYDGDDMLLDHGAESVLTPQDFVPDKRVYPECCDLAFCKLLMQAGVSVPFTGYNENDTPDPGIFGNRKEDLIHTDPSDHLPPILVSVDDLGLELDLGLRQMEPVLGSAVSSMLGEVLDRPYRRAKYKGDTENLKLWLRNIPSNVEWKVQQWLEKAMPFTGESTPYRMPATLAQALVDKVSKAVYQHLNKPELAA